MIKHFLILITLFLTIQVAAQTGIGTTTPDPSAKLEVNSNNKGFLPPRVSLTGINDNTTILTPATGLLVYCKGDAGLSAGYYFWNGTVWATIATSAGSNSVEYISVQASSDLTITASTSVKFNTTLTGNIPYDASTGFFTLSAGKTYRISGFISLAGGAITSSGAEAITVWRTSSGSNIGNYAQILSANTNYNSNGQGVTDFIYTPTTTTTVSLYVTSITGTVGFRGGYTSATITQVGSSAVINPWTLSGTNTYNTTGNVGIGTSTPTSRLNIAGGGIKLHNGFSRSNSRPSLNTASIGNYEIRGVGSIVGNTQEDLGDDGFLRLSAGGGTNTSAQSSIDLSGGSDIGDMSNNIVMRTAGVERLRIDNSGNVNVTGKLNVGDPTGNVVTKVSGFVNLGSYLTLDNLKATVPNVARKSLSIAAVATTFTANVSATYGYSSGASGYSVSNQSITTSTTSKLFDWHFDTEGDGAQYLIHDKTNTRMYRVSIMTGVSANSFFISIERLL